MRAERALRGEPQHLRTECREHARDVDLRPDVRGAIHRVKVLAHVLERTRVALPTSVHNRRMTYAKPEQEAAGVGVDQGAGSVRHRDGIARPDVGDAGRDDELLRGTEKQAGVSKSLLTPEALRNPERFEPE